MYCYFYRKDARWRCSGRFEEKHFDDGSQNNFSSNVTQRVTQTCKQKWDSRGSRESEGAAIWEVELFFSGWLTVDNMRLSQSQLRSEGQQELGVQRWIFPVAASQ